MLKHRLLMSAILIPATIALFAWDHHLGECAPVLLGVVLVIATRCVWELVTLARAAGYRPSLIVCWVGIWATIIGSWLPVFEQSSMPKLDTFAWWPETISHFRHPLDWFGWMAIGMLINAIARYPIADHPPSTAETSRLGLNLGTLAIEFFIIIYIGLLLIMTSRMRWLGPGDQGYFALGALVIATKMGDVGAYTFGRLIGGLKMTPKLSPGKTWAGGVGHLVIAGLSSIAWLSWIGPHISNHWRAWEIMPAVVFGVVVGLAGLLGDLAESLIKRDVGVKDAPVLFPGFGGLLDVMDSLLLGGPVAYWMWRTSPWVGKNISDLIREALL